MKAEQYLQNYTNQPFDIYGKVPPQAKELEDAVLGAILLEKNAIDEIESIITEDSFYVDANRIIFKACKRLASKNSPIDLFTVVEELKGSGELEIVGGPYAITIKTNQVVSAANIIQHAQIVQQKFLRRKLIQVSGLITSMAYDDQVDEFDLLEYAEKEIMEVGYFVHDNKIKTLTDVVVDTVKKINELKIEGKTITGIPTGFDQIDIATRGWQPEDLIIIAARPSVGKTAFLLNIVRGAIAKGTPVAFWSLEMSAMQLVMRMIASESEVWLSKIQTGKLEDHELAHIQQKASELCSHQNIYFDDKSAATLSSVRAKARRLKKKHNIGLIVIDYLQLMSGDDRGSREQEISKISRGLKNLARELQIPIIALSQLSRDVEKGAERDPNLSDLRESGAIEQDADLVGFLFNPHNSEIQKNNELRNHKNFKIAKHRNGVLIRESFKFNAPIQKFTKENDPFPIPGNLKPVSSVVDYSAPIKDQKEDEDLPF